MKNGFIWEKEVKLQGFSKLGIKASFATSLEEMYNFIKGNYGLAIEVTFKVLDILEEDYNKFI